MYTKTALRNSMLWFALVIAINFLILFLLGEQKSLEFLGGYVVELSLSIDNLFLFLLIFSTFNIPPQFQQRVLNYGIIGAMILRLVFISIGINAINRFHWLLYILGLLLLISGLKVLFSSKEENNFSNNRLIIFAQKIFPITNQLNGEKFFQKKDNKLHATPLLLVLILIEFSDVIFALDSIPAIFAITTDPWIVYTSNILAILGLRSFYFLLAKLNSMFKYIKYGVAFILIFTGIKLSILFFNISIDTLISLMIILIILLLSLLFSLIID